MKAASEFEDRRSMVSTFLAALFPQPCGVDERITSWILPGRASQH